MLVMDNREQITFQLTYLHDKKSLMRRYRSVSECGRYPVTVSFAYTGWQSVDYE